MIKMEDPKDILKSVQAELLGVSPDKVIFSDLREKKKKKKVKKVVESESEDSIIDNGEGFSLTGGSVEYHKYSEIGKKKKRLRKKNNLEEWGAFDFFVYAQKKYIEKYGSDWDLNIGGGGLEINKIKGKFSDLYGFCCNLIMRDYIDFFFENYLDNIINTGQGFYFRLMRKEKIMCEFFDSYNFSQSFLQYTESEKVKDKETLTREEIKESYQIGDTSLVSNYGIVISINWLIKVKKETPTDAVRAVLEACKDMASKNMLDVVKAATEAYSPYPSAIPFKVPQMIIDRIDKNIKLNVEFHDNDKYQFLQKKEK